MLESLEVIVLRDQTQKPKTKTIKQQTEDAIKQWFQKHKAVIDSLGAKSAVGLLSSLLPERRPDRVYSIQAPKLSKILGRCLGLGSGRLVDLMLWQKPGHGDLGQCVQRVFAQAEFALSSVDVSVDDVHQALGEIAEKNRFSAPQVRALKREDSASDQVILKSICLRLQSREAKWLTRLILKNFATLKVPEYLALRLFDPRLPTLLRMQSDLEVALLRLKAPTAEWPSHLYEGRPRKQILDQYHEFRPQVGTKVGRDFFIKARNVKHIMDTADRRTMVLERKYDGEYCQIHVDLQKGDDWITIFSKNGRDSTEDREKLQATIKSCLGIGTPRQSFSKTCILEGEMVVWSDHREKILEFHKIRKHVARAGSFIGIEQDSQYALNDMNYQNRLILPRRHHDEHLMIVLFDVLLIDDHPVMEMSFMDRRTKLEEIATTILGRAIFAEQDIIQFSKFNAAEHLLEVLAYGFTYRWEGFIMKSIHAPYFNMSNTLNGNHSHRWMKVKRQAIPGLGDMADLIVLGASYHIAKGALLMQNNSKYTHFHTGCLLNKEEVVTQGARPRFAILDDVSSNMIPKHDLKYLNDHGQFQAMEPSNKNYPADLKDLRPSSSCVKVGVVFRKPFVCEVLGFGVEKLPGRNYYTLRFPRIVKIHSDRDHKDTLSYQELQEMASNIRRIPIGDSLVKEVNDWKQRLRRVDRGKKRALACWETSQKQDSDIEEDGEEFTESETECLPPVIRKSPRRVQRSNPISLVRMDTIEMIPGERRLPDGNVSSTPVSQQSIKSFEREGSLPTPPISSQARNGNVDDEQLPEHPTRKLQSSRRKRTYSMSGDDNDARRFKKMRRLFQAGQANVTHHKASSPSEILPPTKVLPLKEGTNISKENQGDLYAGERVASPVTTLELVRKSTVDPITKVRMHGKESASVYKGPSSLGVPAPQSDENTNSSLPSPSVPLSRDAIASSASTVVHTTTPSVPSVESTDNYTLTRPNLATAHILLSPCIAGMLYLTEDLLAPGATTIALPRAPTPIPVLNLNDIPSTTEIILLVEWKRAKITGPLVGSLMPSVLESGRGFEKWDWRVCEEGERWESCFLGRVWRSENGVAVRFGEGKVRWVSAEKVREKERQARA